LKTIADPDRALGDGLTAIRAEFSVPKGFPAGVIEAATRAVARRPSEHVDRTAIPFVTLDPASSTDLDQAFWIESTGSDLVLRYAIADIAWFVEEGDAVDVEAWKRGETIYLPDGKAGLYPPILSEAAASLLPGGPRPATIFVVRVGADGHARLDGAERALIESRAKLAYDHVRDDQLPAGFAELARRIEIAGAARGAIRLDPPEQEVTRRADGSFELSFRGRSRYEDRNAALSLATNLAIAETLQVHRTGLFRVMARPDAEAVDRLRLTARALGLEWPPEMTIEQFERGLDPAIAHHPQMMIAIRKAGRGASYAPWQDGTPAWHAAVAAPYAHATAPLRRLADRYVVDAARAIANGRAVPTSAANAFDRLPAVMARADAAAGRIERAVVDLAEAILLKGRVGQSFSAVTTEIDDRGARIQLCDLPVVARVKGPTLGEGAAIAVRLVSVDMGSRTALFEPANDAPAGPRS